MAPWRLLLAAFALFAAPALAAPIAYTFSWDVSGRVEYAPGSTASGFTEQFSLTVAG